MKKIILASSSPRRKKLLKKLGLSFEIVDSNFKEFMDQSLDPHQLAKKLSLGKALAVAQKFKKAIIIAADTFIICQGKLMGKAHNQKEAREMLNRLSGKSHLVITGFTVLDSQTNKTVSYSEQSTVYFKKLSKKDIEDYLKSEEFLGKAGAYAIQGLGAKLVEKYEGDYDNIVGLPIKSLSAVLKDFGIQIRLK